MNMEDLFPEFAPISHSQEELLQRKKKKKKKKSLKDPFPEVTSAYHHHHQADLFLVDIQGVVHAPIEETYHLPAANVHVPNCSFNTADDDDDDDENLQLKNFGNHSDLGFSENLHCSLNIADDETLELMDFGNDSHLGFPENLPCSLNIADDGPAEMDSDEVRVLEDLGESPLKNMKSLEMSGEDDVNIVNVDAVNTDDSCSVTFVEGDGLAEMDSDKVTVSERENSDLGEPPQKKMKSLEMNGVDAVNNDNDGCREIPRRTEQEKKFLVFDALRVLAENAKKVEDENRNRTLLETAKSNGITFPHPSWFSKNRKSEIFNFDD